MRAQLGIHRACRDRRGHSHGFRGADRGLLFAFEELANSFSQALGWQIFFACMLAVLTLDTCKSAQHALRRGHFGLFDGDASTVFFEVRRTVFLPAAQAAHTCQHPR